MAATTTPNYGWVQPQVGGDATTWGNELNNDLALIDAQVYANEQAGVPIGAGALWFSNTPPTNWLICNGASLSTTGAYAALFAKIGYAYGGSGPNFNLPNGQNVFMFGAGAGVSLGAIGGASSTVLSTAQLPSHAHPITDVAHNHNVNDPTHLHPDPGHGHGASQAPHDHGLTSQVGTPQPGGIIAGQVGGASFENVRTDFQQPAVTVNGAVTNLQPAATGIYLSASGTGLSTTNAVGSGSPVPTMPPFLGINFIIKYA